ncbi:hypothetical protein ACM66B_003166 [Microbotryomycetes sp. NB124-2]
MNNASMTVTTVARYYMEKANDIEVKQSLARLLFEVQHQAEPRWVGNEPSPALVFEHLLSIKGFKDLQTSYQSQNIGDHFGWTTIDSSVLLEVLYRFATEAKNVIRLHQPTAAAVLKFESEAHEAVTIYRAVLASYECLKKMEWPTFAVAGVDIKSLLDKLCSVDCEAARLAMQSKEGMHAHRNEILGMDVIVFASLRLLVSQLSHHQLVFSVELISASGRVDWIHWYSKAVHELLEAVLFGEMSEKCFEVAKELVAGFCARQNDVGTVLSTGYGRGKRNPAATLWQAPNGADESNTLVGRARQYVLKTCDIVERNAAREKNLLPPSFYRLLEKAHVETEHAFSSQPSVRKSQMLLAAIIYNEKWQHRSEGPNAVLLGRLLYTPEYAWRQTLRDTVERLQMALGATKDAHMVSARSLPSVAATFMSRRKQRIYGLLKE